MFNILVVDDEREVCDFLVSLLSDQGFEAEASTSPREIKTKIQQFGADLLLLDYRMPDQSGRDVVRELRSDEKFQKLPIIILTGLDGEEEIGFSENKSCKQIGFVLIRESGLGLYNNT